MATPMFVITSLRGETDILLAHVSVNLGIGQGLFERNVCHGPSHPDEAILQAFGLSCKGQLQTHLCDETSPLSPREERHCSDFYFMQRSETTALVAAVLACVLSSRLARPRTTSADTGARVALSLAAGLATLLALSSASAVLVRLEESDMVDFAGSEEVWQCVQALGLELCHGYGISFYLQVVAVVLLSLALVGHVALAVVTNLRAAAAAVATSSAGEGEVLGEVLVREPLIAVQSRGGYVIARPVSMIRSNSSSGRRYAAAAPPPPTQQQQQQQEQQEQEQPPVAG